MMRRVLLAVACAAVSWAADPEQVKGAIQRATALMRNSEAAWNAKQTGCNSCHHQYQPAIASSVLSEHGEGGVGVARLLPDTDLDRAVQYSYVIEPAMDDAYRLVAQGRTAQTPNLVSRVYARLIASRQYPDWHWESFHQRPPQSYSRFTQTALALRAVQEASDSSQRWEVQARVARARRWLESNRPRDTEERTYQLYGLLWAGESQATLQRLARDLVGLQRANGGWGSLDGRSSEAYSTGEALAVLHDVIGTELNLPWLRGIDFLLKTQASDGSWHVETRLHPPAPVSPPYFDAGYPGGHDQFLSISASSWAVMALAATLPLRTTVPPYRLPPAGEFEPWAETALFGSAAELKKLLDGGFDPNSATAGGTTALMMAAPDVEKMKLLINRGAKINARAKSGYTALMVACQYREGDGAINFLLDHGAEVNPPAGQPDPLFNAHPLFLAAYAGNAGSLKRLKEAGDSIEAPMDLIGTSRMTPLVGAVRLGDIPVATTLIDLGAQVDAQDGSGMTALDRAVLGNQVEMAKLLIARGVDVNHVDKLGMTPLLYAASIDFGDAAMIDLLLKSGAHADAKNKDGSTALDLARKYQHTQLLKSLGGS